MLLLQNARPRRKQYVVGLTMNVSSLRYLVSGSNLESQYIHKKNLLHLACSVAISVLIVATTPISPDKLRQPGPKLARHRGNVNPESWHWPVGWLQSEFAARTVRASAAPQSGNTESHIC
jgi:hypothetical protein